MELEDLKKKIDELNFNDIVKEETITYLIKIDEEHRYLHKDYRKLFLAGLKTFHRNEDKIIYLLEALNYFAKCVVEYDSLLTEYSHYKAVKEKKTVWDHENEQSYREWEQKKKIYEAQIFYVVRDLEKLGMKNLDSNAFNAQEVSSLRTKIDTILAKLDKLSIGQEVIFDSINELKTDFDELKSEFPLGKKRWYQRAAGIIVTFAAEKGSDEIYDALKPLLKDFFQVHAQHLLDKL